MTQEELFQQADEFRKDGTYLLEESKLLPMLEQYGTVHITGSYSVDLMVNGDIDLYVVLKEFKKETVVEILNKLVTDDYFRGFYYGDYIKHPKEGFPQGHYLGLNKMHKGNFWKFDVWFLEETDKEKDSFMENIKQSLTEEKRYEILRKKQERIENKEEMSSFEIYKQVLELK